MEKRYRLWAIMMAQILEFPYARIKLEIEPCEAVILRMPERKDFAFLFLPFMFTAAWLDLFKIGDGQ